VKNKRSVQCTEAGSEELNYSNMVSAFATYLNIQNSTLCMHSPCVFILLNINCKYCIKVHQLVGACNVHLNAVT
jgi:hypothetical protein